MNNRLENDPKTFVLDMIANVLRQCEDDIKSYMASLTEDYLHYFTLSAKSHFICVMKKQQFEELRTWVEAEEDNDKIIELLEGGIQFMTKCLLNYRRVQSTNELHNLAEEYKLEMYSKLIPTYQQMVNRTRSLRI